MAKSLLIIFNCFGIAASVFGFALVLWHLWRGTPNDPIQRQRQAKWSFILSGAFAIILVLLSLRLTNLVYTYPQERSLAAYTLGDTDILYPQPYKFIPNLEFVKVIKSDRFSYGPKIIEQRKDGFKVSLDLDSHMYKWRAEGIVTENQ